MPELPEVETVRRGLERLVVSRTISSVEVKVPKMIKTSYDSFLNDLPGQTIQAMRRRGKYLIFDFGQLIMISHLRMEGKYLLFTDQVPANKHFPEDEAGISPTDKRATRDCSEETADLL